MLYILLGGLAIALIALAWWSKPSPTLAFSFLTTAGAITIGDLFVNATLKMYVYRPGLLLQRRDNYLGVLLAECLFVPAYFMFLSILSRRHRYWVYSLAVLPILAIEILFLRLGVYVHRTWTLWHSLILFLLYGIAAAYLAQSFERRGYTVRHRLLIVAATVYYAMNLWGLIPFGILRISTMHLHLIQSAELDLVLSSLLLHAVPFTLIGLVGTWYRWTRRPAFLIGVGVGFALWLTVLQHWGIWEGRFIWNPWFEGASIATIMAGIGWLDRWFSLHAAARIPPWEPPAGTV